MSSPTLVELLAFVYWRNRILHVIPFLSSGLFVSIFFAVFPVKSGISKVNSPALLVPPP